MKGSGQSYGDMAILQKSTPEYTLPTMKLSPRYNDVLQSDAVHKTGKGKFRISGFTVAGEQCVNCDGNFQDILKPISSPQALGAPPCHPAVTRPIFVRNWSVKTFALAIENMKRLIQVKCSGSKRINASAEHRSTILST